MPFKRNQTVKELVSEKRYNLNVRKKNPFTEDIFIMKKILFSFFVLAASLLVAFNFGGEASAKTKKVSGYITWYNGVGKVGADGKRLGHWDCATKMGFDVPRKGTKIRAYSKAKPKKAITVYKYDVGRLPGAVLDVSPKAFRALGYSTSKGKVAGHYTYKK